MHGRPSQEAQVLLNANPRDAYRSGPLLVPVPWCFPDLVFAGKVAGAGFFQRPLASVDLPFIKCDELAKGLRGEK